ncbi:MAG TPA: Fic family protein [Nanoarchaeota archaeon]|nr:MAG: filamentation induced by cAMP protein fic [archaeon GW2011_AR6]HIH17681.1 Fic family protein [Nanoarchaeota archaeon]HIH33650.1 Fic family protein [Nanoarchaeota archaeon]HIH51683.1 Fic family protein [Nanoarchaeota archaeon]HIH66746.1 Fic family protein [Nanoarchaeota archaeon]
MVYIYKKKAGERTYYYLRASKRKGDKVIVKDIAYLGSTLDEVKNSLEKPNKYSPQIRKAYRSIHNFLESNKYLEKAKKLKLKMDPLLGGRLAEIEACKLHYNSEFKRQQSLTKEETLRNFIIEFAYNTTAIEGNTIKLAEARNLLEEGLTPKNKSLREIYDIQNTRKVFLSLLKDKEELSHNFIIGIHKNLMENIDPRVGYRTSDVRVLKANFKATPFPYVRTDMDLLLRWYDDNKAKFHPLALASIFHHKFEKIHPFMDGNGRTGRMLLNYILLRNDYPPLVIKTRDRRNYLAGLGEADRGGLTQAREEDYERLVGFIADQMVQGYWSIFL